MQERQPNLNDELNKLERLVTELPAGDNSLQGIYLNLINECRTITDPEIAKKLIAAVQQAKTWLGKAMDDPYYQGKEEYQNVISYTVLQNTYDIIHRNLPGTALKDFKTSIDETVFNKVNPDNPSQILLVRAAFLDNSRDKLLEKNNALFEEIKQACDKLLPDGKIDGGVTIKSVFKFLLKESCSMMNGSMDHEYGPDVVETLKECQEALKQAKIWLNSYSNDLNREFINFAYTTIHDLLPEDARVCDYQDAVRLLTQTIPEIEQIPEKINGKEFFPDSINEGDATSFKIAFLAVFENAQYELGLAIMQGDLESQNDLRLALEETNNALHHFVDAGRISDLKSAYETLNEALDYRNQMDSFEDALPTLNSILAQEKPSGLERLLSGKQPPLPEARQVAIAGDDQPKSYPITDDLQKRIIKMQEDAAPLLANHDIKMMMKDKDSDCYPLRYGTQKIADKIEAHLKTLPPLDQEKHLKKLEARFNQACEAARDHLQLEAVANFREKFSTKFSALATNMGKAHPENVEIQKIMKEFNKLLDKTQPIRSANGQPFKTSEEAKKHLIEQCGQTYNKLIDASRRADKQKSPSSDFTTPKPISRIKRKSSATHKKDDENKDENKQNQSTRIRR